MNIKQLVISRIRANIRTYTMVLALIFIWILFGILTKGVFFAPRNISNLFRQMTMIGYLACGMLLVLVTGGIDLSVGSVTGFVCVIVAYLQANILPALLVAWLPNSSLAFQSSIITIIAVISGLLVGLAAGVAQGYTIAYLGVPAFIVTLGGQLIFRGGVLGITRGKTIVPIVEPFKNIAQGYISRTTGIIITFIIIALIFLGTALNRRKLKKIGLQQDTLMKDYAKSVIVSAFVLLYVIVMNSYRGIQNPVLLLVVIAFITNYISKNTRFGRYIYALGGNREATRLSGIDIKKNTFLVYGLMGILSGVSGIVLTGYIAAGTIAGGMNYELDAIASCVIGGVSLSGGSGSVIGALIGAVVMASLVNGMSVMNMDVFWQNIVKGIILILAVYVDVNTKRKNA